MSVKFIVTFVVLFSARTVIWHHCSGPRRSTHRKDARLHRWLGREFFMRVLLVEDHTTLRDLISDHLCERGFAVDAVSGAEDALVSIAAISYDAAIIDLGLPEMGGLELLTRMHAGTADSVPTLVITARDSLSDRVRGLNAGADDYLVKPFDLDELEARLRALLRRPRLHYRPILTLGRLVFDPASRQATVAGRPLELTRRETAVLEELVRSNNKIIVKEVLEEHIYGFDEEVSHNALEATISRLRKKLTTADAGVSIQTKRGIGYLLHSSDLDDEE
jgi:two-component system response regulator QseB